MTGLSDSDRVGRLLASAADDPSVVELLEAALAQLRQQVYARHALVDLEPTTREDALARRHLDLGGGVS